MGGCGCGKKRRSLAQAASSYTLEMPDGSSSEHPTKLAAEAENIRKGGDGKVKTSR
jgi:hypothetical protein